MRVILIPDGSLVVKASEPMQGVVDYVVQSRSTLRSIEVLSDYITALQAALSEQVWQARREGCSWMQIGDELGTSKQAAHQRYGP